MTTNTPRPEQDILFDKANELFDQRKFKEAFDLFLESYELGNQDAAMDLAAMLTGFFPGVDRDFEKSMSYYRIAMKGNMLKTVVEDALLHSSWGYNPVMNEFGFKLLNELVPYLKPVHLNMIYQGGITLMNGCDLFPSSQERALKIQQFAADHGYPNSAFMAGLMILNGRGCKKDPLKALEYIRKAADLGSKMARGFLENYEEDIKNGKDTGFNFGVFSIRATPVQEEENGQKAESPISPKTEK